jgi:hypothetical protein
VGVAVSINKDKFTHQIGVKNGLLHHAYVYHALGAIPKASYNWVIMDLEKAFNGWKGLPKIAEHKAACFMLTVGTQGIMKCNCKGECMCDQ